MKTAQFRICLNSASINIHCSIFANLRIVYYIVLCLKEKYFDIPVENSDLLLILKEQKPYIRIIEKGGIFEIETPLSSVRQLGMKN